MDQARGLGVGPGLAWLGSFYRGELDTQADTLGGGGQGQDGPAQASGHCGFQKVGSEPRTQPSLMCARVTGGLMTSGARGPDLCHPGLGPSPWQPQRPRRHSWAEDLKGHFTEEEA